MFEPPPPPLHAPAESLAPDDRSHGYHSYAQYHPPVNSSSAMNHHSSGFSRPVSSDVSSATHHEGSSHAAAAQSRPPTSSSSYSSYASSSIPGSCGADPSTFAHPHSSYAPPTYPHSSRSNEYSNSTANPISSYPSQSTPQQHFSGSQDWSQFPRPYLLTDAYGNTSEPPSASVPYSLSHPHAFQYAQNHQNTQGRPSVDGYPDRAHAGPPQGTYQGVRLGAGSRVAENLAGHRWWMQVRQQPERARLCSFKEENDTIDRRPVDPPPVVQIMSSAFDTVAALLDNTHLFVKVNLVAGHPAQDPALIPHDHDAYQPYYPEIRLQQGTAATTGEALQTPEKLLDLEGKEGAFCVFGKLSIRMPGVFRLRFVLYNTVDDGVEELCHCISDPFEVFSPKLFKGMNPSTTLTRHFASQGFKIKLRQGTGSGKSSQRKRKELDGDGTQTAPGSRLRRKTIDGSTAEGMHPTSIQDSDMDGRMDTSPRIGSYREFGSHSSTDTTGTNNGLAHSGTSSSMNSSHRWSFSGVDGARPPSTAQSTFSSDPRSSFAEPAHSDFNHSRDQPMPERGNSDSQLSSNRFLPPIAKAVEQSSVWFKNAGLLGEEEPDQTAAGWYGGRQFKDGIRYGGDDGFIPPMSFGKLPKMIYEGVLPPTPGAGGMANGSTTDLSNFSLRMSAHPPASGSIIDSNISNVREEPYGNRQREADGMDGRSGSRPWNFASAVTSRSFEEKPFDLQLPRRSSSLRSDSTNANSSAEQRTAQDNNAKRLSGSEVSGSDGHSRSPSTSSLVSANQLAERRNTDRFNRLEYISENAIKTERAIKTEPAIKTESVPS